MLMILEFADYKKMHNFYLNFATQILMVSYIFSYRYVNAGVRKQRCKRKLFFLHF